MGQTTDASKNNTTVGCRKVLDQGASPPDASLRFHALGSDSVDRLRRSKIVEQGPGCRRLGSAGQDGAGEHDGVLQIARQRPDHLDPRKRQQLLDEVDAKLGPSFGHEGTRGTSVGMKDRLWLYLLGNAELLKHLQDVSAAPAAGGGIEIGDRLGGDQGTLQRLRRADVGPGRP